MTNPSKPPSRHPQIHLNELEPARHGLARGEVVEMVSGRGGVVFNPDERLERRSEGAFGATAMRIDPLYLAAELEAITGAEVRAPIRFALGMRTDAGAGAFIERLIRFLVGEIERGEDLLDQPLILQSLHQALARALLLGHSHDHDHLLSKPAPASSRADTARRAPTTAPPSSRVTRREVEAASAATVILVVDDDPLSLRAVTGMLERAGRVVRAFTSPRAFLAAAREADVGCAVVDLHMPELSGLEIQAALAELGIALPIVFLTGDSDAQAAVEAMKQGAVDYLVKPMGPDELDEATSRAIARGAESRRGLAEHEALAALFEALTPREREVCDRVATGMLNKQIAAELDISESTVKIHRARGMDRLGARSAAELATLLARLRDR